jgi:hypothetical protein
VPGVGPPRARRRSRRLAGLGGRRWRRAGAPGGRWKRPAGLGGWRWPAPRQLAAAVGAVALALLSGALAERHPTVAPSGAGKPRGTLVLVLTRDLAAGALLGPGDLRRVRLPAAAVPADAVPGNRAWSAPQPGPGAGSAGGTRPGAGVGAAALRQWSLAVLGRRGDVLTRRLLGEGRAPSADPATG